MRRADGLFSGENYLSYRRVTAMLGAKVLRYFSPEPNPSEQIVADPFVTRRMAFKAKLSFPPRTEPHSLIVRVAERRKCPIWSASGLTHRERCSDSDIPPNSALDTAVSLVPACLKPSRPRIVCNSEAERQSGAVLGQLPVCA